MRSRRYPSSEFVRNRVDRVLGGRRISRIAFGVGLIVVAISCSSLSRAESPIARRISGDQCKTENGEVVSGMRTHECPEPEKFIADVSGYHCACICCGPPGVAQKLHPVVKIIATLPYVEKRNGVESVWGIDLVLSERLSSAIVPDNFSVWEDKHSRELRKRLDFALTEKGARLRAKFKVGLGDFGSGNSVTFTIRAGTPLASGLKTAKDVSARMATDRR